MVKQQPEQQAPPVQRLRVRYAKRGRLRFTSHRDFSRAFERAVFRARIPMAYSSGFNPHPRISYAGAAPTGSASEAEYLEIGPRRGRRRRPTSTRCSTRRCPHGLDVLEVVESPGGSLADLLEASRWRIGADRRPRRGRGRGRAFLAADEVLGRADDQEGHARVRQPRRGPLAGGRRADEDARTYALDVVLRHGVPRPCVPTTCCAGSRPWRACRWTRRR